MNTKLDEAIGKICYVCKQIRGETGEGPLSQSGLLGELGYIKEILEAAKAEQSEQIKKLESQLFGEKVCYEAKKKIASELADDYGEARNTIDRLTADLLKHGGHTIKCNFDAILEGGEPKCTCGWSEIEQGLKKKEDAE